MICYLDSRIALKNQLGLQIYSVEFYLTLLMKFCNLLSEGAEEGTDLVHFSSF